MFIGIVETIKRSWENLIDFVYTEKSNFDVNTNGIQSRMKNLESKYNSKSCHPYKPHIFSLKSKKLLCYINEMSSLNDKMKFYNVYNSMLRSVCSKLYDRFDPSMIYTFNNEIHLVFYYNEDGNYQYEGNINKLLTNITSYASIIMNESLKENKMEMDFTFDSTFVEFDLEYECLNYIVWRQLDCKRNVVTLLYKCHKNDKTLNLTGIKLKDLQNELYANYPNFKQEINNLMYGTVLKKEIIKTENNSESDSSKPFSFSSRDGFEITKNQTPVCERKKIVFEHFWLCENFTEIMDLYIINKFLGMEFENDFENNGENSENEEEVNTVVTHISERDNETDDEQCDNDNNHEYDNSSISS
jgi:tRNA(His) 5'-end guanylyltransferase